MACIFVLGNPELSSMYLNLFVPSLSVVNILKPEVVPIHSFPELSFNKEMTSLLQMELELSGSFL